MVVVGLVRVGFWHTLTVIYFFMCFLCGIGGGCLELIGSRQRVSVSKTLVACYRWKGKQSVQHIYGGR